MKTFIISNISNQAVCKKAYCPQKTWYAVNIFANKSVFYHQELFRKED